MNTVMQEYVDTVLCEECNRHKKYKNYMCMMDIHGVTLFKIKDKYIYERVPSEF